MTLTIATSYVIDHVGEFSSRHCVYSHAMDDKVIWIGTCQLVDVFSFPDARRNSKWTELVIPRGIITVAISHIGSVRECRDQALRRAMAERPICNMQGRDTSAIGMIVCNETGDRFRTQVAAAEAMRIQQSALSNHLRGKRGFTRVGGYTFKKEE